MNEVWCLYIVCLVFSFQYILNTLDQYVIIFLNSKEQNAFVYVTVF